MSEVEGNSFSFNIETTPGFPTVPEFTWSFNGVIIPNNATNPTVFNYPNISFSSLSRTQSGNYSITVYNDAGTMTGYFTLDVTCK